ncbi:MAG: hypothetical protein QOG59_2186 [Solirubrobacteraceae bacterium]|jgi:hypothetical protein|nr:hypothetical protein [Solirubrobacteraceae bacterium]
MPATRVLLVANRTATDEPLVDAGRSRAQHSPVTFHLLVPATPQGLHRVVDPEVAGHAAAQRRLALALSVLSEAAGQPIDGHVGDANPLAAVQDALHLRGFDEIILSTLPWRVSRWMRVDLPSKVRALGLPVLHVSPNADPAREAARERAPARRALTESRA